MTAKHLVTAASGAIGQHVVTGLRAKGIPLRATTRNSEVAARIQGPLVEVLPFDIADPSGYDAVLEGIEKIFLVCPLRSAASGIAFMNRCRDAGVKHIVRISVLEADAEPINAAKAKHLEEDRHLMALGVPYTILRPSNAMDNYTKHFAEPIKQIGQFFLPNGDGKASLTDMRDVAEVAVLALTEPGHEGKIYSLTGPAAISNHEAAEVMSKVLGKKVAYVDIPEDMARTALVEMGNLQVEDTEPVLGLHRLLKEGHLTRVTNTVEELLGKPARDFETFMRDNAAIFR